MVHHHQGGSCRYTSRVPPSLQWLIKLLQFAKLSRHSLFVIKFWKDYTCRNPEWSWDEAGRVLFLSSYKNKTNKKAQKTACAVEMERSDPQPCELGITSWGIPLSTCNAPCRVTDKHAGAKREWRKSWRAEETYRMDQPQDHKKGHVNLNVHTTTKWDRHPITQYNTWSRPSVTKNSTLLQTQCRIPFANEKQIQQQLPQKVGLLWWCSETARQGYWR